MKKTVKLSLGMCLVMLAVVLTCPFLSSPKLVLRSLPKDVYEAGRDHPTPSPVKRFGGHLLLLFAAVYMIWACREIADDARRERLSFLEAWKRFLAFLYVEKVFDIACLDQFLCMGTKYYQHFYPETADCAGWRDRGWNAKNQAIRLILYPFVCAIPAWLLTRKHR